MIDPYCRSSDKTLLPRAGSFRINFNAFCVFSSSQPSSCKSPIHALESISLRVNKEMIFSISGKSSISNINSSSSIYKFFERGFFGLYISVIKLSSLPKSSLKLVYSSALESYFEKRSSTVKSNFNVGINRASRIVTNPINDKAILGNVSINSKIFRSI